MKTVFLIFVSCTSFAQLQDIVTEKGTKAKLYLPVGYDTMKSAPLMVFLHGVGERGTDLNLVLKNGTPNLIFNGMNFPFALVAPQILPGKAYNIPWILEVLNHVKKNYKINSRKVWLVGLSFGGGAVWMCAQNSDCIKNFSAFVPICGASNDRSKAPIIARENVPGWAWHSNNDTVVPYYRTKEMVDTVNLLAGKELIKMNTTNNGHSSWTKACDPVNGLYDWLMFQRQPDPSEPVLKQEIISTDSGDVKLKIVTKTKEYTINVTQ